jgi:hypothetical protein
VAARKQRLELPVIVTGVVARLVRAFSCENDPPSMTDMPVWLRLVVSAAKGFAKKLSKLFTARQDKRRIRSRTRRWFFLRVGKVELGGGCDKHFNQN